MTFTSVPVHFQFGQTFFFLILTQISTQSLLMTLVDVQILGIILFGGTFILLQGHQRKETWKKSQMDLSRFIVVSCLWKMRKKILTRNSVPKLFPTTLLSIFYINLYHFTTQHIHTHHLLFSWWRFLRVNMTSLKKYIYLENFPFLRRK